MIFEDINKHLPQLEYLDINFDNFVITDKVMNSLTKLLKSKIIQIRFDESEYIMPLITDSGLIHVINNCQEINSIEFNGRPNMSHKTIDTLIALSLRKLRIDFNHRIDNIKEYDFFGFDEDISFTAIDLKSYKFPNNLVIY